MYDSGITNVVGDNSIAKLRPSNPYHGIITTQQEHGFSGIFIIPRQATNIHFSVPFVYNIDLIIIKYLL